MPILTPQEIKELKAIKRDTLREMRERGIKRVSCFNGGLDGETYRLNARLYEIAVKLGR